MKSIAFIFQIAFPAKKNSVWVGKRMVYPTIALQGVPPNPDLPDDIAADFQEARRIVSESPRGAAALLRLCIQKLCKHLNEEGVDLNRDIGSLVKKGLSVSLQQALDVVRVIGNESVHPGQMDLRDNKDTALALFGLVNIIADQLISTPKHIQRLYDSLPASKIKSIENRNSKP